MDSPESWAVAYLAFAAAFGVGELLMPGTFFLLPFAAGGVVASIISLLGAPVLLSLPVFLVVSVAALVALRPLAHRLDKDAPTVTGIGANRLNGATATVTERIDHGGIGMVRVEGEEWRAETIDRQPLEAGTSVIVVEVRGTRLIVVPNVTGATGPPLAGPPLA
ncbi:MAG: NfeD family protein [Acidimicrobiales bacterium]